jgi:putative sterol carrier protein
MNPQQTSSKPAAALKFAVLKNLTSAGTSPGATLKQLAELLAPAKLQGSLKLQLLQDGKLENASSFQVSFGGKKQKSRGGKAAHPVELITTPDTWTEIASGRLAPHDAFLGGRMRVRGDLRLAQLILRQAAGSAGLTFLCREEK